MTRRDHHFPASTAPACRANVRQGQRRRIAIETLPRDATLLIIDVQEGLDDPALGKRNNSDAEANIARLLAAWRRTGRPIVHVQHLSQEPSSPLRPDRPGVEIKALARPQGDEPVIRKHVNSAFIGTDLEAQLRASGVRTLVIAGLTTNHCVETTTRMAGNLGFDARLVADATAAFDLIGPDGRLHPAAEVHAMTLANLHQEFATITDTDRVLEQLEEMRAV